MPKISEKNIERISEQILHYLYSVSPRLVFTSDVARELARDEEFVKGLLVRLQGKGFVVKVDRNPEGIKYVSRCRWRLSNKTYDVYKKHQ